MKLNRKLFLLLFFVILFLGAVLRFYQLGAIPNSLDWDEVSFGYNAYSLLHTGKDEYGESLPATFRAFGDYKQPVYMYLDTAAVAIFGPTPFAVRFPSAFFGTASIVFVFLFVLELFRKYKYTTELALLSMFFFAISPWSIQFSRGAFEANVSLFLVISGAWLFLRGLFVKKPWYFFLSAFLISLSSYTYISQKVTIPFIFIALLIYGWTYLKKRKVFTTILIFFFVLMSSLWLFNTNSVARGQGVFFANQQTQLLDSPIKQMQTDQSNGDSLGALFHNRRIVYAQTLITNYLSHFNPLWIYVHGDEVKRHHAPGFGLLYLATLPLLLLGIYFLLSRHFSIAWPLFVWFLIAPIASALTFEAPHSLRSLIFLPTWHIFEAAGVLFLIQMIRKRWLLKLVLSVFVGLFLFNFVYYLHQYFVHTNTDHQKDWQYGYKEAIEFLPQDSHKVIFSKSFEQPYIFYLFYKQYDPQKYINSGGSARISEKCYTIDNAYFGDCIEQLKSGDLYITVGNENISKGQKMKQFNYANGETATAIYKYE